MDSDLEIDRRAKAAAKALPRFLKHQNGTARVPISMLNALLAGFRWRGQELATLQKLKVDGR